MEIKAKDIEGFLIEKKDHCSEDYADDHDYKAMGRNKAIDEQGEKVLVIELCDCTYTNNGHIFPSSLCKNCKGNGFTVRAKT